MKTIETLKQDALEQTKPIAPPLPDVTPAQQLALLARCLFSEGYDDHLAGHITYKQPDGTFLVNPFGLTWDELRASDVMRIDAHGNELEGKWTVTPAITLHLAIHALRDDIKLAVHNHPRWSTIWADVGRAPEIFDQTGAQFGGDVAVCSEYDGPVNDPANAAAAARAMGQADVCLLANHGVVVLGSDVEQVYLRAMSFEWRCRRAWEVSVVGGGRPMDANVAERFGAMFANSSFPGLFASMARRELRRDPMLLD